VAKPSLENDVLVAMAAIEPTLWFAKVTMLYASCYHIRERQKRYISI